ncbi:glycoside hydrolase [Auricularia subglabra TFB-10046 SS5]|nr:glycoside hydrolase [Auricularia subglabra TFB-10046 SS5]
MAYRPPPTNVPPLRVPTGYDAVAHPPPSPRLESAYSSNADIQDDPYLQNPNMPPGRFYGQGMQGDYSRQSLAASEVSLHHPAGGNASMDSPYPNTPYDSATPGGGYKNSSSAHFNPYRDEPDAHQMSYLGDSRTYESSSSLPPEKSRGNMYASPSGGKSKKRLIFGIVAAVIVVAAIGVCVYIFIIKPKSDDNDSEGGTSKPGKGTTPPKNLIRTGGDGSTVTMGDGTTFTYRNQFGGFWVDDPDNPFNDTAQAQSYTPPLNQPWVYGTNRIRGVNVGGWLVLEPFISPAMFEKYPGTVDEYDLSLKMQADTANGGFDWLKQHYETFITEKDFAEIAGAGLNWVRVPIGFWAIETWEGEPHLAKVSWDYFLKSIHWARKYGLRINLDLHAVPGSQNGWNHSGRFGRINFMAGVMGVANAQRTLTYMQLLTQFISQPQYKNVVPMFGILNEALTTDISQGPMASFYYEAYQIIRGISGVGEGNGPMISIHDGFLPMSQWNTWLPNRDRVAMDTHFYFAFAQTPSNSSLDIWAQQPCKPNGQQSKMTAALTDFGVTTAGEFSLAINDCGLNVNGVGLGTRFEGTYVGNNKPAAGSCIPWNEWETWTPETIAGMRNFALMEMDALQNYFFWTWKIGNTTTANPPSVRAPFWSYQLGLKQGWIAQDPREADGKCPEPGFDRPHQPFMTGGVGANDIPPEATAAVLFPPAQIKQTAIPDSPMLDVAGLPRYTPTGALPSLPAPTFPDATGSIDAGNGIANPQFTLAAYVPIAGCSYLGPYDGAGAEPPAACAAAKRSEITPAPAS